MTTTYLFAYYTLDIKLWKIFKKSGEIKNKLRKIYPNNHENFKNTNSKSRVQLLALKECTVIFITTGALCQIHEYFSVIVSGNVCK